MESSPPTELHRLVRVLQAALGPGSHPIFIVRDEDEPERWRAWRAYYHSKYPNRVWTVADTREEAVVTLMNSIEKKSP